MTAQEARGFLAGLAREDRVGFLGLGQQRRYRAGAAIFMEGDRSDFVGLLREGRVKVFRTTTEGREPFLAVRGPGDLVGELAAIDGDLAPRVAGGVFELRHLPHSPVSTGLVGDQLPVRVLARHVAVRIEIE